MRHSAFVRRPFRSQHPRPIRTRLSVEVLEDRTVLSATDGAYGDLPSYPGEWIAQFRDVAGTPQEQLAAVRQRVESLGAGLEVRQHLGADGLMEIVGPDEMSYSVVSDLMNSLGTVEYTYPNFVLSPDGVLPNDTRFAELYGLHNTGQNILGQLGTPDADIDAPEAWDITLGSSSVVVGVLDSGVAYTHPDLAANIYINAGEVAGNGLDDDGNGFVDDVRGWDFFTGDSDPRDEHGHGTHVAGTIAALGNNDLGVIGVAPNVKILPVRWLGPNNTGPMSAAIASINYVNMMRDRGHNILITNNSWGGPTSAPLESAIAGQRDRGILFVAAAGNSALNNDFNPAFPANLNFPNIISVAASDNQDNRAGFSNWGLTTVDLAAPGLAILSTLPTSGATSGNATGYGYFQGTSMATPHVAGTAALLWSLNPSATYQQVRDAILGGVDPVFAFRTNGPTPVATGGRLNAFKALQQFGLAVVSTSPANGGVVNAPPTEFVVNLSLPYDPASVDASDLTVNGIAADGFVLTDPDTITFTFTTSPVTAQGLQTVALAAGSISPQAGGAALLAYSGGFRFDLVPLQVVSASPAPSTVVPLPMTFLDLTFNEPVDPASVSASDLVLSRGTVTAAEVVPNSDNRTVRFSLSGLTTQGSLNATLSAGAVADGFGNPGPAAAFSANYGLNAVGAVFPVPLTPVPPLGSLAYTGFTSGLLGTVTEQDSYTLSLDAAQTVTVVVTPPGEGGGFGGGEEFGSGSASPLRAKVTLTDPNGVVVAEAEAPTAGARAILQVGAAATLGTYTITVSTLAGTDAYSLLVYLNAAVEDEALGGPSNSTRGTAQDLDPAFLDLLEGDAAQRAAVRGQLAIPATGNLITNGNFETGNFNGWTVVPAAPNTNTWQINNGTLDPGGPNVPGTPTPPIGGSFDAVSSSFGPGLRSLSQSFVVPATVPLATLSWSDRVQNFASAFAEPNQEFRVQLLDATGTVLQTVYSTNPGDPLLQPGPNNRSFDVTPLLQSRVGQTLQLRFQQEDSLFAFNVTLDNISLVVGNPTAGPADDFYALDLEAGQPLDLALALSNFSAAPSFSPTRTDFPVSPNRYPIAVGYRDLNGDGKLDMVAATNDRGSNANGAIGVWLGNGDGTFGPLTEFSTNGGVFTRFLDFGDVNADGKIDVVATSDFSGHVSLFRGRGDGTFETVVNVLGPGSPLGLTVRDLNGDGRADAVVPHFGGLVSVLLAQPNGTLGTPTVFSTGAGGPFGSDVGDLNGDGRLDIVTANFSNGNMSVLLANANGTYGPATVLSMGPNAWDIALADFNGDGRLDAVTANQGSGNIAVRLGNGNGTFGNPMFFSTGGNGPRTVSVGDVNNDGRLDVVVPNIGSRTIAVLPGNGNGTFGAALTYATGLDPNAATLADVNGDGFLDLSSADAAAGNLTVRLNTTPTVRMELQDAAGNVVAAGTTGATNYHTGLSYTPSEGGTYYVRVFGNAPSATYTVVATRSAAFDAEPNDTAATAQDITAAGGVLGAITSGSTQTVVPNVNAAADGNFDNSFPFNSGAFGFPSMRYQQVYARSQFSTAGIIDALRFRQDPFFSGTFSAVLDIQINLGYAARTPTNFSPGFADNVGPGSVTVFNGQMTISSTATGTVPRPFDIVLNVDDLFRYDPAQGDLLVDIFLRNGPAFFVSFDAVTPTGTPVVARAFSTTNVTATQGIADPVGLVTRFDMLQPAEDWYAVDATAGQTFRLETFTPAGGPGEFVNNLNPRIELFDPNGVPVALGVPKLDGRNEVITYQAALSGMYRVRLSGQNSTAGEYFLSANFTPVALDDSANTAEDTPVVIDVLANDVEDRGLDPTSLTVVSGPANGTVQLTSSGEFEYIPDLNFSGTDTFSYTVRDNLGLVSNVAVVTVTVEAVADAPTLTVDEIAAGDENTPIPLAISAALVDVDGSESLSLTISEVPSGGGLSAGTDNGDGTWSLTPAQLVGLTITLPDNLPGEVPFTLNVTATAREASNASEASTTKPITVTVRNVAPDASVTGPASGVRGQPLTFTGDFTDVGILDTHEVSWDFGDGTVLPFRASTDPGALTPTHAFVEVGTYTVRLTVRDDDGGTTTVTHIVAIGAVALQPDPQDPGKTALFIGGTDDDDDIHISPVGNDGRVKVKINGVSYGIFQPTGRIVVYGQAGDDDIDVAGSVDQAAWLYGGDGDDRLKGGAGNNVLLGGAGDDRLTGGKGRNLLIGGTGEDRLEGQAGEDILIGGTTSWDDNESALWALMQEWTSSADRATRVGRLRGTLPGGANGPFVLNATTVHDDGDEDRLTGGSGIDWFFASCDDDVTDRHGNEPLN